MGMEGLEEAPVMTSGPREPPPVVPVKSASQENKGRWRPGFDGALGSCPPQGTGPRKNAALLPQKTPPLASAHLQLWDSSSPGAGNFLLETLGQSLSKPRAGLTAFSLSSFSDAQDMAEPQYPLPACLTDNRCSQ